MNEENKLFDFWSSVFSDPGFLGALFGALITGGIALIVYSRQNRENKKRFEEQKQKEEDARTECFIREFYKLQHIYRKVKNGINNVLLEAEKSEPENDDLFIKSLKKDVYEIQLIKEENIPNEVFTNFLTLKKATLNITEIVDGNIVMEDKLLHQLKNMGIAIERHFNVIKYYKEDIEN